MFNLFLKRINDLFRQKIFILLALDKAFQFFSQLLIVFVYRHYIGLSNYADFVFALVFFTLISAISNVGMDRLLLERFSIENKLVKWNQLLFSSIFYKLLLSVLIIIAIKCFDNIGSYYYGSNFVKILFILSFGLIGQSYLFLDAFCQAKKKNIITVKSRITVVLIINFIRFYMLYYLNDSFYWFLWTFPLEQIFYFIFSLYFGQRYFSKIYKFVNYHFDLLLLKRGIFYTLSVLLVVFQMKYIFSIVKTNLTKEFYEFYSIASYLCDITFSIPALLSLFYRPDLVRYYNTNSLLFNKIFSNFKTNMFTLSIFSTIIVCIVLYCIYNFSYNIDNLFIAPLYLFTLIIPLYFFSFVIQVLQLTINSFSNFLIGTTIGSIFVYLIFFIVKEKSSNHSLLIILTYLFSFFVAQIIIPLILERKKIYMFFYH